MKLKYLFNSIPLIQIHGSDAVEITGITAHSKQVKPGDLFIAKTGRIYEGSHYAKEAIQAGAVAILSERFDPFLSVVQMIHPQVQAIEAQVAATYYDFPSYHLFMSGITGTNGKTTTSFILRHLLQEWMGTCGLIGTIEYILGNQSYPATRTTPDVVANHHMLSQMVEQGCQAAVMEVTSHALDQGRVAWIDFDVAIFTNLTRDHLDYHQTMENYCQAKRHLFKNLGNFPHSPKQKKKWAIINQESPWSAQIVQDCQAQCLTYAIDQPADLQASEMRLTEQGTYVQVSYQGEIVECHWPLVGRFNVSNCLAAMAVLLTRGVKLSQIAQWMRHLPAVRGRLEPVPNGLGLKIYVDFAHSDDALKNVLETLNELKSKGRLIVVFGCGGDRDRTKRPKMAEVCEQLADFSIVTSDNPRSEDPATICQEIVKGFSKQAHYKIELDRAQAIQQAILSACADDIILIAGKGHETDQIFAHQTVAFDDVQVAANYCTQMASLNNASY